MVKDQFGDFQTPVALAEQCLRVLRINPNARILDPTCGVGNFLSASQRLHPNTERRGVEIQPAYAELASTFGAVLQADVFTTDLASDVSWSSSGPLFIVGNPPWVTSAELNRMGSLNLPPKANFKGAKGIDALLGGSNFDVCEFVILKCLRDLQAEPLKIAMLCKTQVARNVIEHASSAGLPISSSSIYRIDAKKWFGAAVDACLFIAESDPLMPSNYTVEVFEDLFAPSADPVGKFGIVDGRMVSNVDGYLAVRGADGVSTHIWRSGLKHDAAGVFEIDANPGPVRNGEPVDLEDEWLFPLLKSTDIFRGNHRVLRKWVIVPQKTFGAETASLAKLAPKLWSYLEFNSSALDGRKSSIYRSRPRFSVFGHGDYTYAPYKVAVSGLHKKAVFRLVCPIEDRPVVLDDTCYFLPFDDSTEAAVTVALLNSPASQLLIESLVFWDSKRPITKKLLSRLNLNMLPRDGEAIFREAQLIAREAGCDFDLDEAKRLVLGVEDRSDMATLF